MSDTQLRALCRGEELALDPLGVGGDGAVHLALLGDSLGFQHLTGLDVQDQFVVRGAVLAGPVVVLNLTGHGDHVALVHLVVQAQAVLGRSVGGDEALTGQELGALLAVLGREVVLDRQGQADLLGAVGIFEDNGVVGQSADELEFVTKIHSFWLLLLLIIV